MAKPPPHLLDPTRYPAMVTITTRYADMDPNQHINNVAMAAAFEDSRVRFDEVSKARGLYAPFRVMIVAAYIDYLAEAHYPDPLTVHAGIEAVGRSSWVIAQLATQGGVARAFCRSTMVARSGGGPADIDAGLRPALEAMLLSAPDALG